MNILMLSLLYPDDQLDEVTANAKDKIQNQINNYQRAFVDGIRSNLGKNEHLDILNSLPVGIYPLQYRKLFLKKGVHDQGTIFQLGCINLPWFKQKMRAILARKAIEKWASQDTENRCLLLYTQYLPYVEAVLKAQKKFPDLRASVIVTDLPNEWGIPSGRRGLLKKIEYALGKKSMRLMRELDGFVLLTEPMADILQVRHKPYMVIEGLIRDNIELGKADEQPAVLYTGTLKQVLGVGDLIDAFKEMPQYELWLCGQGDMQLKAEAAAKQYPNIHYYGFVSQKEALAYQAKAAALINPRTPVALDTKYSFPSKTLEYMRSGKPVICYKLEGIPDEYDSYLTYIPEMGSNGIVHAVKQIMALSAEERMQNGKACRDFVLQYKNPTIQCKRLMDFLRSLS